jgi:hypothetical protein
MRAIGYLRCSTQEQSINGLSLAVQQRQIQTWCAEQKVLTRIRRARTMGKSYRAIAESLNRAGIPTKNDREWYASSVRSVFLTSQRLS